MRRTLMMLVLLTSCRVTEPGLSGELFVLESIDGAPLPALYTRTPDPASFIVADTIALGTNSAARRHTLRENAGERHLERARLFYTRSGNDITLNYECSDTGDCLPGPHLAGLMTPTGLTITESKVSRAPLVFRRLLPPD